MEENALPFIPIVKKSGDEAFHRNGHGLGLRLLDFWRWAASDLIGNAERGVLAEYIVASALGLTDDVREGWNAYDLATSSGVKIEVKSSAYLQSWNQKAFSNISFSIRPSFNWDAQTNTWDKQKKRQADIYVFCLLNHKDQKTIDPLNLDQWDFFILPAMALNTLSLTQATISLAALQRLNPTVAKFDGISQCVEILSHCSPFEAES